MSMGRATCPRPGLTFWALFPRGSTKFLFVHIWVCVCVAFSTCLSSLRACTK